MPNSPPKAFRASRSSRGPHAYPSIPLPASPIDRSVFHQPIRPHALPPTRPVHSECSNELHTCSHEAMGDA
eukprot:355728-Chlamydomonas_euryale.AAC.1